MKLYNNVCNINDAEKIISKLLKKYKLTKYFKTPNSNVINKDVICIKNKKLEIESSNIFRIDNKKPVSNYSNTFLQYFENKSTSREKYVNIFYQFRTFELAYNIIKNNKIQFSAIPYYWRKNDILEYFELLSLFKNHNAESYKKYNQELKNVFVTCFTKKCNNNKFWKEYGDIALGFRLVKKYKNIPAFFQFRDVIYNNHTFNFIKEIRVNLFQIGIDSIDFGGSNFASRFFKRGDLAWEEEMRMCIDFDQLIEQYNIVGERDYCYETYQEYLKKGSDNGRDYIELNLLNPLFELRIEKVICSKKINDKHFYKLKDLCIEKKINIIRTL